MFRPRDPQSSLLASSMLLTGGKRERLECDWPGEFRQSVLPPVDEELFRDLYCQDNGCPNKPAQTIAGVLILKEIEDLADMPARFFLWPWLVIPVPVMLDIHRKADDCDAEHASSQPISRWTPHTWSRSTPRAGGSKRRSARENRSSAWTTFRDGAPTRSNARRRSRCRSSHS